MDFEEEFHRYEKEQEDNWKTYYEEHPDGWAAKLWELDQKLSQGVITAEEYQAEWEEWRSKN